MNSIKSSKVKWNYRRYFKFVRQYCLGSISQEDLALHRAMIKIMLRDGEIGCQTNTNGQAYWEMDRDKALG